MKPMKRINERVCRLIRLITSLMILCLFLACHSKIVNPVDYSEPAVIAYTITGGFAGIMEEANIDVLGNSELKYDMDNVAHYRLSPQCLDSLKCLFRDADFFNLKDEYMPDEPIMDGFFYSITYNTMDRIKSVTTQTGADHSIGLEHLLEGLHEINGIIRSNAE